MPWEAPNLLDKIFREPEVADSQVFNNFMGGFLAARDRKAQAGPVAPAAKAGNGDDEEGGASGDAEPEKPSFLSRIFGGGAKDPGGSNDQIYVDKDGNRSGAESQVITKEDLGSGNSPLALLSGTPAVDTSWVGNWMRSSLEGQQMGKNITAYQQAITSTATQRAQLAGDLLKNQETAKHIQDSTEDDQAISKALEGVDPHEVWNTPAPFLKTAEGRLGWAQMQTSSANTLMAKAKQEQQAKMIGEASQLLAEGFDVLDAQGNPDPKKVQAAGAAKFERTRKLELDKAQMITDRQYSLQGDRLDSLEYRERMREQAALKKQQENNDAKATQSEDHDDRVWDRQSDNIKNRGQWNEKLLTQKQQGISAQSDKLLGKAYSTALNQELIAVRMDPTLTSAQKSQKMDEVIAKYGLKGKLDYSKIVQPAQPKPSDAANDPLGIRGNGK